MKNMTLKRAAGINAVTKYAVVLMNIFFTAILARVLTPQDYGIIASISIFTVFFNRISDIGFGTAVIQYKELNMECINDIYSFTIYLGIILSVIFTFIGIPISKLYGEREYIIISFLLSFSIFFNVLNIIPNAVLLRDKQFFKVGIRSILVNIVAYFVALIIAIKGGKYYALVFQSIISAILVFVWNIITVNLRFRLRINWDTIRYIWKYSMFQFVFNWVNYLETNLDNILVSIFMGKISLAYYDRSYKLLSYPVGNLSGVITPVLHPVLKDYQYDKEFLYLKYLKVQNILSLVAMYIFIVGFVSSEEIIKIFYGTQWVEATKIFQYLSIALYPKIIMSTTGSVYCSIGKTNLLFLAGGINATITCIAIVLGIYSGSIEVVAFNVGIANWVNSIVTFSILIIKGLQTNIYIFIKDIFLDIIFMFLIAQTVIALPINYINQNILLNFFVKILFSTLLYLIYVFFSKKYIKLIAIFSYKK